MAEASMKNSEIFQSTEELRKAIDSLETALDLLKEHIKTDSDKIELEPTRLDGH